MNVRRLALGTAGLLLLGVGTTASGEDPVRGAGTALVSTLGNDYLLVVAIGAVAMLVAGSLLVSGRSSALDRAEMPDPEGPMVAEPAGREFDETVHGWRFRLPVVGRRVRDRVRERLREAAVETVVAEGRPRADAERLVENGSWTTDPAAGAFLASGTPPSSVRMRAWFAGRTVPEHCADRVATAIADRRAEQ